MKLYDRLRDKRGASLLFVLLLALVATLVSIITLAAATSTVKTVKNDQEDQQAYLSVSSAALLFRDCMEGATYTTTVTRRYEEDQSTLISTNSSTSLTTNGGFKALMQKAVDYVESYSAVYKKTFTIEAGEIAPVTVRFEMKPSDYSIKATFTMADDSENNYVIGLTAATKESNKSQNGWNSDRTVFTKSSVSEVTWETAWIAKGEAQ